MGRAPCCQASGLKKGPWSEDEDQILVSFIQNNGHGNWRSLPKRAGLLRCGKSCRLRWTNYLRPDIKRGNFTKEEEDAIIRLHEMLGNRWSAIAAELPGRTDNEIKNIWHTHLKKRLGSPSESHNVPSSVTVTVADTDTQPSSEFTLATDLSPLDWFTLDLEANIWSEEFMVPDFGSPVDPLEEDDMDFWLRMLIEAGDIRDL